MDVDRAQSACALARRLKGAVGLVKVGSQLFTADGPRAVQRLANLGFEIFLDLKFHDIPNTVAGAVRSAVQLPGIRLLTLHTLGGAAMMAAARDALAETKKRPALLGVTILTSMDDVGLAQVGVSDSPGIRALALAKLAKETGLDGVVASPHEVEAIRAACGPRFLIVVPGVRPVNSSANDQSRISTPSEAVRAGADYLVVGRPITGAPNPREAARKIIQEITSAASFSGNRDMN